MTVEQKQKIAMLLKNNTNWPLILDGVENFSFKESVILPAQTTSENLGVVPTEIELQYPDWLKSLIEKSKNQKLVLLLITNIDEVNFDQQELFYGILKYKGVNGFKFPKNVQIVLPVKQNGTNKISKKILSLAIIHKVD